VERNRDTFFELEYVWVDKDEFGNDEITKIRSVRTPGRARTKKRLI
jgi:hypothetical protein